MENIIIKSGDLEKILVDAILSKCNDKLKGYKSPLDDIVAAVIEDNTSMIKLKIKEAIEDCTRSEGFAEALKLHLDRKLAGLFLSKCDGLIDKSFSEIMKDALMRNKLQTAVINIIGE